MAKFTLEVEEDYDFDLIGICSHIKDYRLSWELNNGLGFDLSKDQDFELSLKGVHQSFSFFSFIDEDNLTEYYLLSNRSETGTLIPEQNNCDYFLLIKGNSGNGEKSSLIRKISALKHVLTSFEVNVEELKSKNNLLF